MNPTYNKQNVFLHGRIDVDINVYIFIKLYICMFIKLSIKEKQFLFYHLRNFFALNFAKRDIQVPSNHNIENGGTHEACRMSNSGILS